MTWPSYKVTSFLDFQPSLEGSHAVYQYLENLRGIVITPNTFKDLYIKMHQPRSLLCQMKLLSTNISAQYHVNSTPSIILQNLKLNSINWRFNTLIKYFMLLIENFLQPYTTLTIILHRYRTPPELREVKNMLCVDITALIVGP